MKVIHCINGATITKKIIFFLQIVLPCNDNYLSQTPPSPIVCTNIITYIISCTNIVIYIIVCINKNACIMACIIIYTDIIAYIITCINIITYIIIYIIVNFKLSPSSLLIGEFLKKLPWSMHT
jgi:hypothetical protein